MDKSIRKLPFWMILILWVSLCVVGLHFLADSNLHGSMALVAGFPASQ